ncbi:HD domain-containing protein [Enterococcus sp. AZ126]|uniref:HD domain-containing protein n=1 Tax=Enterococcus sp. AZ126 TaxID=2774635 RepID=UPI003F1FBC32
MDNQKILAIKQFAQSKMKKDQSGHGMDHINRVVRLAEKISATETCDRFIITAAAYLHDTVDDKLVSDSELAFQELTEFLKEIQLSTIQIQQITHIIKNLSFSQALNGNSEKLTIEGQIVQDADRLDAMGAIGITRTIYYGASKGNQLYDPKIKPRTLGSKAEYREESTIINHFYEKILLLNETLNTDYAKVLGKKRHEFLESFLTEFFEEWD